MARGATWTQQTLIPAEAVDAVLRIGIVGASGHLQLQLEVRDASSGDLLAMESMPHRRLTQADHEVDAAAARLLALCAEFIGPF